MWQIWIILAGIFMIFEMIIPTDILIFWVGIGAALTSVCSLFTDNITVQIAFFCISSILLIFCTKPFVRKFTKELSDCGMHVVSNHIHTRTYHETRGALANLSLLLALRHSIHNPHSPSPRNRSTC